MPVYVVTGKLGGGKTLAMVGRLREYIEQGRPVATNIELHLRKLLRSAPKAPIWRLPDRPTVADFQALGPVHATGDESRNGAIVLDECGTWLNARTWSDSGRQAVIDWFLHSRKLGWDVYLIVQNISLLDKQVRDAMAEYVVTCRRLDRVRIPLLGTVGRWLTFGLWSGSFPRVHLALVRYGHGPGSVHADTWMYKGTELYGAYETTQVIRPDDAGGLHALLWPLSDAEKRALALRPKPKTPVALAAARLAPDDAVRVLAAHYRRAAVGC